MLPLFQVPGGDPSPHPFSSQQRWKGMSVMRNLEWPEDGGFWFFVLTWLHQILVVAHGVLVVRGIYFPNQGSNLGPLHWELSLSHRTTQGSPRMGVLGRYFFSCKPFPHVLTTSLHLSATSQAGSEPSAPAQPGPDCCAFAGAAGHLHWSAALPAALHARLQPPQTLLCGIRWGPGAGI